MTNVEILQRAKALIEDEANWIQEEYALDAEKCCVSPDDPEACFFCAAGAVYKAYGSFAGDDPEAMEYLARAARKMAPPDVAYFVIVDLNDTRTHADVMAMFDEAIRLAQEDEHASQ